MDCLVISSKLLVESMTSKEKSISLSTFQPFEMKPVFLYIMPAVSKNFSWMFFRPDSYDYIS